MLHRLLVNGKELLRFKLIKGILTTDTGRLSDNNGSSTISVIIVFVDCKK
ncbi:unnamed protein product [Schistosoma curassoni]|uniref:Uncharacterized protein n=1 Tax=Schistosoma curassoni TaxID=6186 RepID=A0A183KDL4_9TREM|nr:unnamed protein product [Schistosoma curassoni]